MASGFIFVREDIFYTIWIEDKGEPEAAAAAHALLNPGTIQVLSIDDQEVIWSDGKDGRPDIGTKIWNNK